MTGGTVNTSGTLLFTAERVGAATLLAQSAPVLSVSSGSSIGAADPLRLDQPGATNRRAVTNRLAALAVQWDRDGTGARRLAAENLPADAAHRAGAINTVEPTVGELIVSLDGRAVPTASGPKLLSTATVVGPVLVWNVTSPCAAPTSARRRSGFRQKTSNLVAATGWPWLCSRCTSFAHRPAAAQDR